MSQASAEKATRDGLAVLLSQSRCLDFAEESRRYLLSSEFSALSRSGTASSTSVSSWSPQSVGGSTKSSAANTSKQVRFAPSSTTSPGGSTQPASVSGSKMCISHVAHTLGWTPNPCSHSPCSYGHPALTLPLRGAEKTAVRALGSISSRFQSKFSSV